MDERVTFWTFLTPSGSHSLPVTHLSKQGTLAFPLMVALGTGSCYIAQAGLEFTILLLQLPESQDYRQAWL